MEMDGINLFMRFGTLVKVILTVGVTVFLLSLLLVSPGSAQPSGGSGEPVQPAVATCPVT
jgi:hypothetical protein